MKLEKALYIEPSSDGNVKSMAYARELFSEPLRKEQDIIVNDTTGDLLKSFEQLSASSLYEKIEIHTSNFDWKNEMTAAHDVLELTQPRYREEHTAKAIFVTHGNRKICEFVCKVFNSDIEIAMALDKAIQSTKGDDYGAR